MANWKKIITSGSKAEFTDITGSKLQLTNAPASNGTTPLVIDSSGNVSTGSAYALASGGNTVGGSSLSSSVAIVGAGGSLIQTASSDQNVNFNSADLEGITDLTASNLTVNSIFFQDLDKTSGSGKAITYDFINHTLKLGYDTTIISKSLFHTKVQFSDVPLTNELPFYLGLSSSGDLIKIDQSDVVGGGGSSTITGLTEGSNIDVTGTSTTEELLVSVKTFVSQSALSNSPHNHNVVYGVNSNIDTGSLPNDSLVKVKFSNGGSATLKVSRSFAAPEQNFDSFEFSAIEFYSSSEGPSNLDDFPLDKIMVPDNQIFKLVTTITNATVALQPDISLTNITASNDISASGDIIARTITASGVKVDGDLDADGNISLDGTLSFNGLNFTQANVGIITGSNIFGSGSAPSLITHQFTGSVLITGSNLTLTDGTLSIPGFSDVSASLATLGVAANLVTLSSFNSFTSSIVTQLNVSSSTLQTNIDTKASITQLNASSSTLQTNIDTKASIVQLNASSSTLQTNIDTKASIAQLNASSSTLQGNIDALTGTVDAITVPSNIVVHDGANNVTIGGNLTVEGTTTTISTQDLVVEDRFILIGSGSNDSYDVGLIFDSGSTDTSNRAFYYDASEQRFTTAKNIDHVDDPQTISETSTNYTGDIVTVKTNQATSPSATSSSFGEGEMYIDNNNDIWVYVE